MLKPFETMSAEVEKGKDRITLFETVLRPGNALQAVTVKVP